MKLEPSALRVLYRDTHLLVLEKPAGIATTAPAGGTSLFALAQKLDPGAPQLHPLSRLDTQVTGIVAFARTPEANRLALEARRKGALHRRYLGLTAHAPEPPEGRWTWHIGLDRRDPTRRVALEPGERGVGVKEARTRYRVAAVSGPITALHLWPETGRTHQLRVHASKAGAPLFGDVAYGGEKRLTLANGRVLTGSRVMLHCTALRMPRVGAREPLVLDLAPPPDLVAVWKAAGGAPEALALAERDSR